MRILKIVTAIILLTIGCEKEDSTEKVQYRADNSFGESIITYKNSDDQMITEIVNFKGSAGEWSYTYETEKGNIIYLSGIYHDSLSSVKLQILIDGKVFKEKTSINEPEKYITVSGTVPF